MPFVTYIINKKKRKPKKKIVQSKVQKPISEKEVWFNQTHEEVQKIKYNYPEFLKSNYWKQVKVKLFKKRGCTCQLCGVKKYLQVHHTDYSILGNEHKNLDTLMILCWKCHHLVHNDSSQNYMALDPYRKNKVTSRKLLNKIPGTIKPTKFKLQIPTDIDSAIKITFGKLSSKLNNK